MLRNYRTLLFPALAACSLMAGNPVGAQAPTTQSFVITDAGISVGATVNGENTYAGRYDGTLDGVQENIFCVDLYHNIGLGQGYTADTSQSVAAASGPQVGNYYQGGVASALDSGSYKPAAGPGTDQQRANEVAFLIHDYGNATAATFAGGGSGSSDETSNLAAIGLSIWKIEGDGGGSLASGTVTADSGTQSNLGNLVTYYEDQAAAHENTQYLDVKWIQAPVGTYQSFAYESGAGGSPLVAPVPEASTMVMFGVLSLGGVILLRRRTASSSAI